MIIAIRGDRATEELPPATLDLQTAHSFTTMPVAQKSATSIILFRMIRLSKPSSPHPYGRRPEGEAWSDRVNH
jgi:hypothetical protein